MCVQPVIRIRKHHVFPVRPFQPGIAGGGKSGIFTGKNLHPAVPAAEVFQNGSGAVRRAVIHADNPDIPVRLVQDAFQAAGHVSFRIVHGNDDGNHGRPPFPSSKTRPYSLFHCSATVSAA